MVFLHSRITCLYVGAADRLKVLRLQHKQVYFDLHVKRQTNSEKSAIAERRYFMFTSSYVANIVGSITAAFSGQKSAGSLIKSKRGKVTACFTK